MASSCGIRETVAMSKIPITINTSHSWVDNDIMSSVNMREHLCVEGISVEQVATLESVSVRLSHRQAVLFPWSIIRSSTTTIISLISVHIIITTIITTTILMSITSKDLLLINFM